MKRYFLLPLTLLCSYVSLSQNVGIGTSSPTALLHVNDSAVLFSGPLTVPNSTSYLPPASGKGVRLMWYPQKGALRAGAVSSTQWDKDNIGIASLAIGADVKASGSFSVALGGFNTASGPSAVALGNNNTASGIGSISLGIDNTTSGSYATSMGYTTIASGDYSMSDGYLTTASGTQSYSGGDRSIASGLLGFSFGTHTWAAGDFSAAFGYGTNAKGWNSFAIGNNTKTRSTSELAIGQFNDTSNTNRLFEIGNGTSDAARSNALTVLLNGNIGIGTTAPALGSAGTGLHLLNSTYTQLRVESSAGSAGIEYKSASGHLYETQTDISSNFFIYDRTAGAYRFFLNSSGNLGLGGNTNPTAPLTFPASLTKKITLYPGGTGDVGLSVSGNDLRIYADNVNARVSFGYDDFTNGFTSRAYVPASGTNALVVLGNMLVNGTAYSSDIRFKKNIQPITGSLDRIQSLQGVWYEMNRQAFPDRNFAEGQQTGLIAQEVEKIIPEVVSTAPDGYKSVDYAKLVPYLIEGIKTQQQQLIQAQETDRLLKEKVDKLQLELEKQHQELQELKKILEQFRKN